MEETKKYKLVKEPAKKGLFRIVALRDIDRHEIVKGQRGGLIQHEDNLSQNGDCWIGEDSVVIESAVVRDDAFVGKSDICGDAIISGYAKIYSCDIRDYVFIEDAEIVSSKIIGDSDIRGDTHISSCVIKNCLIAPPDILIMINCDLEDAEINFSGKIENSGHMRDVPEEDMAKKYRMEPEDDGRYRIIALKDIKCHGVIKGQRGGLVENETNLSQEGDCWIDVNSIVSENGIVCGDAFLAGSIVSGDATVGGKAKIYDSEIFEKSVVNDAEVHASTIGGTSDISGSVYVDTCQLRDCKLSPKIGFLDIQFSDLVGVEMNYPARILDAGRYDGR